jgi:hypothetical protein
MATRRKAGEYLESETLHGTRRKAAESLESETLRYLSCTFSLTPELSHCSLYELSKETAGKRLR